ncbi:hypothetical protein [Nocardioides sp. CER19]|nr:hypothetical protein [Nocardioides sp. CER19]MDH2413121.1 hypothetical protein [Nocardioides sp. CER19]
MRKPLRCRIGWHKWVTRYSDDGTAHYLRCRRCSKEDHEGGHRGVVGF